MSKLERLIGNFERELERGSRWREGLAPPERVWIAIYDPSDERRIAARLIAFENAAKKAECTWHQLDMRDWFADWMAKNEYKEAYFESPEDLGVALGDFKQFIKEKLKAASSFASINKSFIALYGIAALYPFVRTSEVMQWLAPLVAGRVLVWFPGEYENGNMRFLGARDGWTYQAVIIRGD